MRWFGEPWNAPICDPSTHTETPIGQECLYCSERIHVGDQGVIMPYHQETKVTFEPYHLDCLLQSVGAQ